MTTLELTDPEEIDAVLRSYPWMDCELHSLQQGNLTVAAGVALHYTSILTPDLLLEFQDVFLVIAPRAWTTDTGTTVLSGHDGAEARALGLPFLIDVGYTLFQLRPEDLEQSCWIAARAVRMTQLRRPEQPLALPDGWSGGGGWLPSR